MSFEKWFDGLASLENAMPPSRGEKYSVVSRLPRDQETMFRPGFSLVGDNSHDDREMREYCTSQIQRGLLSSHQAIIQDKATGTQRVVVFAYVDQDSLQFLGNRLGKDGSTELLSNIFRDDDGIRRHLDENFQEQHRQSLRDWGLPRMPRNEAEWQWVHEIREFEKRGTSSLDDEKRQVQLATRPPYYRGFVDDSYVDLWVRSTRAQTAKLRFRGAEFEATIPVYILQTDRARLGHDIHRVAVPAEVRVWVAFKLTTLNNQYGRDILLFNPSAWEGCKDPDVFDDIELDIDTASEVSIVASTVVFNDLVLADFDFPEPLVAKQLRNASLKEPIFFGRLGALIHDPVELQIVNSVRRSYSASIERPDIQLNPILLAAATELGQSWHEQYKSPWNHRENSTVWEWKPRNWCSEFVLWCIWKATTLDPDIIIHEKGVKAPDLIEWFTSHGRFTGPTNHPSDYPNLGSIVLPGFYISVKDASHSTIFIDWWDPIARKITNFDGNVDENFFLAIGGNQSQGRVHCDVFSVSRTSAIPKAAIYWDQFNILHGIDREGFGDCVRANP